MSLIRIRQQIRYRSLIEPRWLYFFSGHNDLTFHSLTVILKFVISLICSIFPRSNLYILPLFLLHSISTTFNLFHFFFFPSRDSLLWLHKFSLRPFWTYWYLSEGAYCKTNLRSLVFYTDYTFIPYTVVCFYFISNTFHLQFLSYNFILYVPL